MSAASQFAAFEAAFADLRERFGGLYVGRARGERVGRLATRYAKERRALAVPLAAVSASPLPPGDREALANVIDVLRWMDELEPVAGARADGDEAGAEDEALARERLSLDERYGRAQAAVRVDGETLDRLTIFERLGRTDDGAARRRLFEALEPVWQTIDGQGDADSPYRRLVEATSPRWQGGGSPIEAGATAIGLSAGSLEPALWRILGAFRRLLPPGPIEPWDYAFLVGSAERRLHDRLPVNRLGPINDAHLRALGADPAGLGIEYDIEPRDGRPPVPVAFTITRDLARQSADGEWRAATPSVVAEYRAGGLGNLRELLHESGHALHFAAIRARPALSELPEAFGGFVEGIADVLGWDADEPGFQSRHIGVATSLREGRLSRYGAIMLDLCWALFEIEMYRSPERRPNDVWTEITERGLGIVRHPEWSWWAVRAQLVEAPGYMANYALSAIVAAAVRARLLELRGEWWTGDPGWYAYVSKRLLVFGAARRPAGLLEEFLRRPLSEEPLIADLELAR
ncbi:MAG: hypothetical protein ACJ761_08870 [Chloroflexota bacterium]